MRNIINVAWFSIKGTIRKKSFFVSNIIILAIIFIIFNIINFVFGNYVLSTNESNGSTIAEQEMLNNNEVSDSENSIHLTIDDIKKNPVVAIVDSENIVDDYIQFLPSNRFDFVKYEGNVDDVKTDISNGDFYSAVNIYVNSQGIQLDYIVYEQISKNSEEIDYITAEISKIYLKKVIEDNNLSQDVSNKLQLPFSYNIKQISQEPQISISIIVGLLVSFVLFMSIYMYGHSISLSIASEKDSRVIETLVTSASPTHIILGKTLGMGILGLLQLIILILFTFFCYNQYIPSGIDVFNIYLSDINLSFSSIVIICIYFVLGYILYAFLNAIAGAIVNKAEDVQTASLPLYFISMISFYLSIFTIGNNNKLNAFTTMFPLSSPFAMPANVIGNLVNGYEIISSILLLGLTSILFAFISIRIYSVAILHYGNKMKLKNIFNIFIRFK